MGWSMDPGPCFVYVLYVVSQIMYSQNLYPKSVNQMVPDPIKDDFQSVLRSLEGFFTTFVLFPVRRHKM